MSDLQRLTRKYLLYGGIAVCLLGYIVFAFAKSSPLPPNDLTDTSSVHFQQDVEQSPLPVMVDFWSARCGPCIEMEPTILALLAKYNGKLQIYRLVGDNNPDIMKRYDVSALPTLIFFKQGKVVSRVLGKHPQETIEKYIEKVLQ